VLAGFVGFEVISKVPNTLHTPLMSGTNAIHGIVLLGGLLVVGFGRATALQQGSSFDRVAFGTINVVGGFLVTDRMLEMFKQAESIRREEKKSELPLASFLQPASCDVLYIIVASRCS
jgi:NAD(P) transhydrogenase subunit alpha